ncbi:E3 ubiquitin-protein ligase listerin [Phlyctema vagabunda]|uniref:E3 ubiquitin-protein ligase listerin n=1 Tax=Phlyctema vagabunda TaxID=108571 RepID=A0ABR4PW97_9HELO
MSKRQFKSQASSSRASASAGVGGFGSFGTSAQKSTLSYLTEPPNFSSISDPNVVVSFKNLSKKDRATKIRGLEELRSYVRAHPFEENGGVEEAVLDTWVQLYPRIAIDNDRYVREISHEVQSDLVKSAKRRIEKHIPKIVGTWIAGMSDRDRGVARMAMSGIKSLLDSEEKYKSFLKRCQTQILDFALSAIKETPQTLSDERNTSSDDMQAKYHRVLLAAIWHVVNLLSKLEKEEIAKAQDKYDEFLSEDDTPWAVIVVDDSPVRASVCELLILCIDKQTGIIEKDLKSIIQSFIGKGMRASQQNTAKSFLDALIHLEEAFQKTWTYPKAFNHLRKFVEKGSQGGNSEYWHSLGSLVKQIPQSLLPTDLATSTEFLTSYRKGIHRREEPKANHSAAWSNYFSVSLVLGNAPKTSSFQADLYQQSVFPVFEQYVHPDEVASQWSISDPAVVADAFHTCATSNDSTQSTEASQLFKKEWEKLASNFITRLRSTLPEKSKEYAKSQQLMSAEASRYFSLSRAILNRQAKTADVPGSDRLFLEDSYMNVVNSAAEVLVNREGKPYSAANTLNESIILVNPNSKDTSEWYLRLITSVIGSIKSLLQDHLVNLVLSPSGTPLISLLHSLFSVPDEQSFCDSLWKLTVRQVLAGSADERKVDAICALLYADFGANPSNTSKITEHLDTLAHSDSGLQSFLVDIALKSSKGEASNSIFEAIISHNSLTNLSAQSLLVKLLDAWEQDQLLPKSAFNAIDSVFKSRQEPLQLEPENAERLITALMHATQISDQNLSSSTSKLLIVLDKGNQPGFRLSEAIRKNLRFSDSSNTLNVETLIQQARLLMEGTSEEDIHALFPDVEEWKRFLVPIIDHSNNGALAYTPVVKGAYWLCEQGSETDIDKPPQDPVVFASAFRTAVYCQEILSEATKENLLSTEQQVEYMYYLSLTQEVAIDYLSLVPSRDSGSGRPIMDHITTLAEEVISNGMYKPGSDVSTADGLNSTEVVLDQLISKCLEKKESSRLMFYSSRVLERVLRYKTSSLKNFPDDKWLENLQVGFKNRQERVSTDLNTFSLLGILSTMATLDHATIPVDSSVVKLLLQSILNEVDSFPTEVNETEKVVKDTLFGLVSLNACLDIYDDESTLSGDSLLETQMVSGPKVAADFGKFPARNPRQVIFCVKQILSWAKSPEFQYMPHAAESCRALRKLLPAMKDVYGSYWDDAISLCLSIWSVKPSEIISRNNGSKWFGLANQPWNDYLPWIGWSLRLMQSLQNMDDPNDDLRDALASREQEISEGLIALLEFPRVDGRDVFPLPLTGQVDDELAQAVSAIKVDHISDLADLYYLVASNNRIVQSAAYNLLHVALPLKQEQISVDVLLEKRDARLPDELLSLLLEVPTEEDFFQDSHYEVPTRVRGYLLAWHLIYDCYRNASFKVRSDYTEILKSENYLNPLLDFIFVGDSTTDPLIKPTGKFSDALARSYDPQQPDDDWLFVHLYYMCLKFTPTLVKNWWIDCKSKQKRIAVEAWSEKIFSPLVTFDTLEEVSKWAENQEPALDEKELIVKISPKTREVFAGYEVDETMIQISIRLPANYPLDNVRVEGINRVAVSEKKFQSWQAITQGVITFSNGSITDGLESFRKNIISALKGIEECAICYSTISADKKLPDKRCSTCNNLFHGNCLYKWFATSNQSTCPLCRNPFNYGAQSVRRRPAGAA